MHPHLFELPWGGTANAYGTLILLGGLSSVPFIRWDARSRGLAPGRRLSFLVDFYLVLVVGMFLGGRIVHVLTVPGVYANDPMKLVALDSTGFVFFGSLIAVALGWIWLARRYAVEVGVLWDLGLTWVGLGHAFGRLGCFAAGCCWGGPHTSGGGVRFGPDALVVLTGGAPVYGRADALQTLPLHPTQLYEAAGLLALFVVQWTLRIRNGVETPWRMASRYAIGYGCLRAVVEIFRGDASRGWLFETTAPGVAQALSLPPDHPLLLSISQAIALSMVGVGAFGLWRTRPRT
ncbi:MAG: prolipoprotein diacylglyceryl transferase family protein [Myxococcota bacterium]